MDVNVIIIMCIIIIILIYLLWFVSTFLSCKCSEYNEDEKNIEIIVLNFEYDRTANCIICFNELGLDVKRTSKCNHIFHRKCINRWLYGNNTCPVCRTPQ